jgi:type II secretory ATPase GspE/PulE/Tfp pilus assembly ATPase PilB-like protein
MSELGRRLAAELIGRTYASTHLVAPLDFERDVCAVCTKRRGEHITSRSRKTSSARICPMQRDPRDSRKTVPYDPQDPRKPTTYVQSPETVVVGVAEETPELRRALQRLTGYDVRFVVESAQHLRGQISEIFGPAPITAAKSDAENIRDLVFEEAARQRASNILFEYSEDDEGNPLGRVRLDVLGDLRTFTTMTTDLYDRLCGILLRDAIDGVQIDRQVGQRGKLVQKVDGRTLNLRVSTYPVYHHETSGIIKIVMRALRRAEFLPTPESAGLLPEQIALMGTILDNPHCTVLVGGPPGSGKSTTFYMMLGILPLDELNIYGIEDPPEIYQPRITQTAIKPDQNWTVEEALREILRQVPHFAFVGEILDPRIAQLFMAANRRSVPIGSTIHAEDALVIVPALRNFNVDREVIASGMTALASQRLVQHLCQHCRVPVDVDDLLRDHCDRLGLNVDGVIVFERGEGCDLCSGAGITGRSAVFEIVSVNQAMRDAIAAGNDTELTKAARANNYITMLEHAIPLILRGQIAQSALGDFPSSPAHKLPIALRYDVYFPRLREALMAAPRRPITATA